MGALALAALVSCSDEEDILPQQQEKIVSYLTRSHTPTLLSEQDAAQSLDNDRRITRLSAIRPTVISPMSMTKSV